MYMYINLLLFITYYKYVQQKVIEKKPITTPPTTPIASTTNSKGTLHTNSACHQCILIQVKVDSSQDLVTIAASTRASMRTTHV